MYDLTIHNVSYIQQFTCLLSTYSITNTTMNQTRNKSIQQYNRTTSCLYKQFSTKQYSNIHIKPCNNSNHIIQYNANRIARYLSSNTQINGNNSNDKQQQYKNYITEVYSIDNLDEPVILRNAIIDNPLVNKLTFDDLVTLQNDDIDLPCEISVNGGDYRDIDDNDFDNDNGLNNNQQRVFEHDVDIPLSALIQHINERQSSSTNEKIYCAQKDVFDDFTSLNKYIPCELPVILNTTKIKSPKKDEIQRRLWLGPRGTVSPLHCDIYNNIFVQYKGNKLITLFKPQQTDIVKPYRNNYFLRNTSTLRDITSIKSQGITVGLQAGDVLFIPKMWWHHVEAISSSLSVSYWF